MKNVFKNMGKLDWVVFVCLIVNVIVSAVPNWNLGEFLGWLAALCFWFEARTYNYAVQNIVAVFKPK